ncbi:MAG: EAL domain-containing protein [Spirochaetales bacterium]|nr:EAL domain-containing protein [Spirochaetales bacterium]
MESVYSYYQSLLFLILGFSLFTGLEVLSTDRKSTRNRLLFLASLSLSIWIAFILIAEGVSSYSTALLCRRIASFGWSTLYAYILHYAFILSNGGKVVVHRKSYFLLYLPALLFFSVNGLISSLAAGEYTLRWIMGRWIYVYTPTFWNGLFKVYYISYSALTLFLIFRWSRQGQQNKREARVFGAAYGLAILLGLGFDFYVNHYRPSTVLSLYPAFSVFPMAAFFWSVRRERVMISLGYSEIGEGDSVLTMAERRRYYHYTGAILIFLSLLHAMANLMTDRIAPLSLPLSMVLLLSGSSLFFLHGLVHSNWIRETLLIATLNTTMVIVLFYFYRGGLDHFVWPLPVFFTLTSVLYRRKIMLALTTFISIAATLEYAHFLERDISSVLPRIIFYLAFAIVAAYIHRVYLDRLSINEKQIYFQRMVTQISSKLVSINEENLEDRFLSILEDLGRYFNCDETYLISYNRDNRAVNNVFHWGANEKFLGWETLSDLSEGRSNWILSHILNNKILIVDDLSEIPSEGGWIVENFSPTLRSLAAVPIMSKGKILGVLGLNSTVSGAFSSYPDRERMFRIPANLTADALIKIDSEQRINYLAYYDPLTELPNRSLFYDRLEKAAALATRTGKKAAVMMMDLDSFKDINDSLGHDAGDLMLRQVAERLSHRIREYDTMSRFGGDEFLFVLSQVENRGEVTNIAEKLINAMAEPIKVAGESFHITGSIGITLFPDDAKGPDFLIKNADMAMYASKKKGKNCYTFFESEMKEGAHEKIRLTNELYRALEKEEFVLYYQPQLELEGSKIIGMEALIRWNHPEKGLLPPSLFIPLAEDIGLIGPIGRWVLETACFQNKMLQEQGFPPVKVAVNLSIKQFAGGVLTEMVREILVNTGLESQYLELEITEGIAMGDSLAVQKTLHELSDMGITISIDDFGTEYSSLSRLKQMPVDRIKIDKQFVQGINLSQNDESITGFIVDLSKSMNLKVIAEGVENPEQMAFLADKACDEIQGFYFYEPLSFEELGEVFSKND